MKNLTKKIEACVAYGNISTNTYCYTMGGKTEVVIKSKGVILASLTYDRREYYTGRGSKYNRSIRHDYVVRTYNLAQLNRLYKEANAVLKERKKQDAEAMIEAKLLRKGDFAALEKYLLKHLCYVKGNEHTQDNRYWLNGYRGCGVYRLFFENNKIVASLPGGYGRSLPYNKFYQLPYGDWVQFVNSYVKNKMNNSVVVAKADGSGTYFYLRGDAVKIKEDNFLSDEIVSIDTNNYYVPDIRGGMHLNMEIN